MRLLALSLVVLLCVSVSQAAVGYKSVYDFEACPNLGSVLNTQNDGTVTWVAIANAGLGYNLGGTPGDKDATAFAAKQELLVATLTGGVGGAKPFSLESTDVALKISYLADFNIQQGGLVAIWIDGFGCDTAAPDADNAMLSNESEKILAFGTSSGKWRIRGANNGSPSVNTSAEGLMDATGLHRYELILWVNLTHKGGDGSMSLQVNDLTTSTTITPAAYQGIAMGLLSADPDKANPANWTSWIIRSQASAYNAGVGGMTMDNLTIEVIPEPATLSLLVLGGLACLRRRR